MNVLAVSPLPAKKTGYIHSAFIIHWHIDKLNTIFPWCEEFLRELMSVKADCHGTLSRLASPTIINNEAPDKIFGSISILFAMYTINTTLNRWYSRQFETQN